MPYQCRNPQVFICLHPYLHLFNPEQPVEQPGAARGATRGAAQNINPGWVGLALAPL